MAGDYFVAKVVFYIRGTDDDERTKNQEALRQQTGTWRVVWYFSVDDPLQKLRWSGQWLCCPGSAIESWVIVCARIFSFVSHWTMKLSLQRRRPNSHLLSRRSCLLLLLFLCIYVSNLVQMIRLFLYWDMKRGNALYRMNDLTIFIIDFVCAIDSLPGRKLAMNSFVVQDEDFRECIIVKRIVNFVEPVAGIV